MKKILFLFTAKYPYGKGEVFLTNEIKILSSSFDKIYLFPATTSSEIREVPANVFVKDLVPSEKTKAFLLNFPFIIKALTEEFSVTKNSYFIKTLKLQNSVLLNAICKADALNELIKKEADNKLYFYSYWMNNWALTCAILKYKKIITDFFFRVHGFDLYDFNRPGNYIPFRYFNLKQVKKVFAISKNGQEYLKSKNMFPEKVELSYLGTFDNGLNPFDSSQKFRIVSCSSLNINKRLFSLVDVLKELKTEVHWVHIGEGGDLKLEQIKEKCSELPLNVTYELKGFMPNKFIMESYRSTSVNLFINLSTTEGLPVTMMEAISFGIPLLGTDVGGVSEIITKETGVLISKDFEPGLVAEIINDFKNSNKNTSEFRHKVRSFWELNFNGENNYKSFCDEILNEK